MAWRVEGARVLEGDTEVCRVNEQRRDYSLDARLISAAPELLAASKAILTSLRSGSELDAENLRRAIEKAEGKWPLG